MVAIVSSILVGVRKTDEILFQKESLKPFVGCSTRISCWSLGMRHWNLLAWGTRRSEYFRGLCDTAFALNYSVL